MNGADYIRWRCNMQSMFSLGDVAKSLRIPGWKIQYAIASGRVADVGRFAGKRVFLATDISQLATHFGVKAETPDPSKATSHIWANHDQHPSKKDS